MKTHSFQWFSVLCAALLFSACEGCTRRSSRGAAPTTMPKPPERVNGAIAGQTGVATGGDRTAAQSAPKIEVVFALDTTGSMSGLIKTAKEKIWSIASSMSQADPAPDIAIGLVAYRDRGDVYVTKLTPMTEDLDAMYADLLAYQADGGGDEPESVNQALNEAVVKFPWSTDRNIYRVVFLVGDSPPRTDYQDDVDWEVTCKLAAEKDIVINTIQMGSTPSTTPIWKAIAQCASGQFLRVDQMASDVAIETPFDKEIAELADK